MQPKITRCHCGEMFLMSAYYREGCELCPTCFNTWRNTTHHARHTWRPYKPSNGTEQMQFQSAYCDNCHNDKDVEQGRGCDLLAAALYYDVKDDNYPREWIKNELGEAKCTKFMSHEQYAKEHKPVEHIPENQLKLI